MLRLFAVLSVLGLASGCASTTVIRSIPSGAVVKNARGEKVGKTPYTFSGGGTIGATDIFYVEKADYEEQPVTLRKDKVNTAAMIGLGAGAVISGLAFVGVGALPFVVPMFWMADYEPMYTVELEAKKTEPNPEVTVVYDAPEQAPPPAKSTRTARR